MTTLLDTVGNTPLVKLEKLSDKYGANIFAKLEYFNPTSSIKDRIAKYMIEKAEKEGKIKPGDTIIENSSGNTATGLAMISKQKGYKLLIVIRDTLSPDKKKVLQAFGDNVKLLEVDGNIDPSHPDSYNNFAKNYADTHEGVWYMNQHDNLNNPEAHYMTTGQEIIEQTGGNVQVFVSAVGTGGTLSGIGRALREKISGVKIYGVDPKGSVFRAAFYKEELPTPQSHYIEGIGNALPTKNVVAQYIDEVMEIQSKDAINTVYEVLNEEGIIIGPSAGANIWGAIQMAKKYAVDDPEKRINIVTTIGDTGYKYTGTLFEKDWVEKATAE